MEGIVELLLSFLFLCAASGNSHSVWYDDSGDVSECEKPCVDSNQCIADITCDDDDQVVQNNVTVCGCCPGCVPYNITGKCNPKNNTITWKPSCDSDGTYSAVQCKGDDRTVTTFKNTMVMKKRHEERRMTNKKKKPSHVKKKMVRTRGYGLIDRIISRLPFELHLPGYQYCGPGTKLDKRLARGDKGINDLDAACKEHDLAYRASKDSEIRSVADRVLLKKAMEIVASLTTPIAERMAALVVAAAMKVKLVISSCSLKMKCRLTFIY